MDIIMKTYISDRYQLNVLSKTDKEFITIMAQDKNVTSKVKTYLDSIFADVVYIKFAKQQALQDKMMQDIERGVAIIHQTMLNEYELT